MKITENDIISKVKELRDMENKSMKPQRWNSATPQFMKYWLLSLPAATFIGFLLGVYTKANVTDVGTMLARADTVYVEKTKNSTVKENETEENQVSILTPADDNEGRSKKQQKSKYSANQLLSGKPMTEDHIRYDLLIKE